MFTTVGYSVLVRGFRLALSVEGLKPHTINNYVRDIGRFAAAHEGQDPQSVTPADIRAYVLDLQTRCAPKTVYESQLGLRRFFRFLVREGDIQRDPTENMVSGDRLNRPSSSKSQCKASSSSRPSRES